MYFFYGTILTNDAHSWVCVCRGDECKCFSVVCFFVAVTFKWIFIEHKKCWVFASQLLLLVHYYISLFLSSAAADLFFTFYEYIYGLLHRRLTVNFSFYTCLHNNHIFVFSTILCFSFFSMKETNTTIKCVFSSVEKK